MTILVTGAAGGMGRAVYDLLQQDGEDVIAQDIAPNDDIDPSLVGDLCDRDFLSRLEMALHEAAPRGLRAVVAAHGIAGAGGLREIAPRRAGSIMAVNFESVVNLWDRVRPHLERTRGSFVVIVSQAGLVAEAGNAVYCASKFALAGWLRGLAGQSRVRLRAINPGATRTPLLEHALQGIAKAQGISLETLTARRFGNLPAGRIGEPIEVAQLVKTTLSLEAPGLVEVAITGGEVLW